MSQNPQEGKTFKDRFSVPPASQVSPVNSPALDSQGEGRVRDRFNLGVSQTPGPQTVNTPPAQPPNPPPPPAQPQFVPSRPKSVAPPNWAYIAAGVFCLVVLIAGASKLRGRSSNNAAGDPAQQADPKYKSQMQASLQAMYVAKQHLGTMNEDLKSTKATTFDQVENALLDKLDADTAAVDKADPSDCPEDFRAAYKANSLALHNLHDTTKDLLEAVKEQLNNPLLMFAEVVAGAADYFLQNGGAMSKKLPERTQKLGDKVTNAVDEVRSTYAKADAVAFTYHISPNR